MKFSSLLLTSMVAFTQADSMNRGLATLAEKWNITEPEFTYDAKAFTLDFVVTDFITETMVKHTLWTAPLCKEGDYSLDGSAAFASVVPTFSSTTETPPLLSQSGDNKNRDSIVTITFDPSTISDAALNDGIYSENTVDNQVIAEIRFCLRSSLYTPGNTPIEVNFLETLITLTVDLTDGFQIGQVTVEPKDRLIRTANAAYEVTGFECKQDTANPTGNWVPLDTIDQTRARNQGEIITVCVEPEQEAKADGIYMRSIDNFFFSRANTPPVRQDAVVDGGASPNLLTSYEAAECGGFIQCRFTTILFAQFYTSLGQVNGEGVASLQFGTAAYVAPGGRKLRSGARETQDDAAAGAAEFNLQFDVNQAADTTSGASSSIGTMCLTVIAAMGAVAALM